MSLNANAIITLTHYKRLCAIGLDNDKVDDVQIEKHINAASQAIENYCGRGIVTPSTAIEEVFSGDDQFDYYVRHLTINTDTDPILYYYQGGWQLLSSTSYPYIWDEDATRRAMRVYFSDGNVFWKPNIVDFPNWKLVYKYGWDLGSVPDAICIACSDLVNRSIFRAKKAGLKSEAFADSTTSYDLSTLMTSATKELLADYVRMSFD